MSNSQLIQRSLSFNQPMSYNNKNNIFIEETPLKSHKSLNRLGRKKTVSFSENIDIINVDNWKCYNIDVSETNGCFSWDKSKNEIKRKEVEKKNKKKEDGCICIIY